MDPREALRAWRGGRSYRVAGELLGCDGSLVRKIEIGDRRPGLTLANTLKRVIGIPTESWDELEAEPSTASP